MSHHIEILHFDDELDSVDWFPEALFEACYVKYGGMVSPDLLTEQISEFESCSEFEILEGDSPVKVYYRLIAKQESFENYLTNTSSQDVCRIVLLDLIRETPSGTLEPKGYKVLQKLRDQSVVDIEFTFFVSAYPQLLQEYLDSKLFLPSNIIAKPVTATRLSASLIDRIEAHRLP